MPKDKAQTPEEIREERRKARAEARKNEDGPELTELLKSNNVVNERLQSEKMEQRIAEARAMVDALEGRKAQPKVAKSTPVPPAPPAPPAPTPAATGNAPWATTPAAPAQQ